MAWPSFPDGYFNQTATVYTADPSKLGAGGRFTIVANETLPCRLVALSQRYVMAPMAPQRVEEARRRDMYWAQDYVMPNNSQLLIGTERWNVENGTTVEEYWTDGSTFLRHCEVVRAQT